MYRHYEKALVCRASKSSRVKSGKFGHQFNSDIHFNSENPDETAPYVPSHQDVHCCSVNLLFHSNN